MPTKPASSKSSKSELKKQRKAKAFAAFKIAADSYEVAEAAHNVAVFLADGKLGDSDQKAAARYYKLAADKGFGPAQLMLANRLMVPRDTDNLEDHLTMCGVDYSLERALHYAALAARQSTRGAELLLAKILLNKSEFELGMKHLLSAAHEQPPLVEAQLLLARVYQTGLGPILPDLREAEQWLEKAAESDDSEAKYSLVSFIKDRDPERASRLLKEAADDDHPEACCEYGAMLRKLPAAPVSSSRVSEATVNDDVDCDEDEASSPTATAFFYLTKAALHQLPRALVELALMYYVGSSPPDKDEAYATELLQFAKSTLTDHEFATVVGQVWTEVPLPSLITQPTCG